MPKKKASKSVPAKSGANTLHRTYESDAVALQSLRLIAAPNPKDDLSSEQIADYCHKSPHSTELIQSLIEYIKSI
jgi:hypothetical protein